MSAATKVEDKTNKEGWGGKARQQTAQVSKGEGRGEEEKEPSEEEDEEESQC